MRDDDDAPEGMTGKEYVEYMNRRKQQTPEKPRNTGSRSQNVKVNGIPANQQARRDLNKKLREQQKPTKDREEYEKKHPVLTKARRVAGKVHSAIQKTTSRYVEGSNVANRRHEAMRSSGRESVAGTWVDVPVWGSSLPKKKSKKKPSSRSGGSNDYYGISLTNSLTGASYGGGLLGSTLPKKSTNPTHKKKKKTTRRRRY